MKRLSILLLALMAFSCKKTVYQPCDCISGYENEPNKTVISGLYFGATREDVAASGVFDTLHLFEDGNLCVRSCYGGLPADICVYFDYLGRLNEVEIHFPYGVPEDSLSIYLDTWRTCIDSVYGEGCFQRIKLENGWSEHGNWQWDMCGQAQLTNIWYSMVRNQWHPAR